MYDYRQPILLVLAIALVIHSSTGLQLRAPRGALSSLEPLRTSVSTRRASRRGEEHRFRTSPPFASAARTAPFEQAEEWAWVKFDALSSGAPMRREGHTAVAVEQYLVLFGGCVLDKQCFNDVRALDTTRMRWAQPLVVGEGPSPREGHSASMLGTSMWVFGGSSEVGYLDDVWVLDCAARGVAATVGSSRLTMAWGRPELSGPAPSAREGHTATAIDGSIYVFGGFASAGYSAELFVLSTELAAWEAPIVAGVAPTPREGHTATLFETRLVIFGGIGEGGALNDVHVLDVRTMTWVHPDITGPTPEARQDATATRLGGKLLLVGGCNFGAHLCFNDAHVLDLDALEFRRMEIEASSLAPREDHTTTVVRGRVILFGGCFLANECYNDVVELVTRNAWACGGNNCSDRGACRRGMCQCLPGWSGDDCSVRQRCPHRCSGHGACLNTGKCACMLGWRGRACARFVACPNACSRHGVCEAAGVCSCAPGWFGPSCDRCRSTSRTACSGRGVCVPGQKWGGGPNASLDVEAACKCDLLYGGPLCGQRRTAARAAEIVAAAAEEAEALREKTRIAEATAAALRAALANANATATAREARPAVRGSRGATMRMRSVMPSPLEPHPVAAAASKQATEAQIRRYLTEGVDPVLLDAMAHGGRYPVLIDAVGAPLISASQKQKEQQDASLSAPVVVAKAAAPIEHPHAHLGRFAAVATRRRAHAQRTERKVRLPLGQTTRRTRTTQGPRSVASVQINSSVALTVVLIALVTVCATSIAIAFVMGLWFARKARRAGGGGIDGGGSDGVRTDVEYAAAGSSAQQQRKGATAKPAAGRFPARLREWLIAAQQRQEAARKVAGGTAREALVFPSWVKEWLGSLPRPRWPAAGLGGLGSAASSSSSEREQWDEQNWGLMDEGSFTLGSERRFPPETSVYGVLAPPEAAALRTEAAAAAVVGGGGSLSTAAGGGSGGGSGRKKRSVRFAE